MGIYRYRFIRFHGKEVSSLILTSLVFALILGFNEWGYGNTVDINIGIFNTIGYFFYSLIALFLIRLIQKIVAMHYGYEAVMINNPLLLIIAFLLSMLFRGVVPFLFPGTIELKPFKSLRLGKYLPFKHKEQLYVIISPIILLIILSFFKTPFFHKLFFITGLILLFDFLPIPHQDGIILFFFMRVKNYIAFIVFFIALFLLLPYSFWIGILGSIIALIFVYYIFLKKS